MLQQPIQSQLASFYLLISVIGTLSDGRRNAFRKKVKRMHKKSADKTESKMDAPYAYTRPQNVLHSSIYTYAYTNVGALLFICLSVIQFTD